MRGLLTMAAMLVGCSTGDRRPPQPVESPDRASAPLASAAASPGTGSATTEAPPPIADAMVDAYSPPWFTPRALALGARHTCTLSANGDVACWGNNLCGQLGDGTTEERVRPVRVTGMTGASHLAAGGAFTCAKGASPAITCWGTNHMNQLGRAIVPNPPGAHRGCVETNVAPLRGPAVGAIAQLDLGGAHGCVRLVDGSSRCWGSFVFGELGDGTFVPSEAVTNDLGKLGPIDNGLRGLRGIAVGGDHSCAIKEDETVVCWGRNEKGEIGDGSQDDRRPAPVAVQGLGPVVGLGLGNHHSCAILKGGTVSCWGSEAGFGVGSEGRPTPQRIAGLTGVTALAGGESHTCALREDGAVRCWGQNDEGQLGDGTRDAREAPTAVAGSSRFVAIAAGDQHTCGITAAKAIACWGDNERGQLGDGTRTRRLVPTPVAWPAGE